ncbi:MAG: GntR family transcriptional regulator [Bacteroidetes bacterium]|nr:MAG: GntR family transcriptional regulator [Bacteroidota bacterium]
MGSPLPKYYNISLQIISKIKNGELVPGMQIPSENDIIRRYGVSNTTARKVLQELELRGFAARIKGKGTFVRNIDNSHTVERTLGSMVTTRSGFETNMIQEGFVPSIEYLEKSIISDDITFNLSGRSYDLTGPIFKIRVLRLSDNIVMKDETRYIPLAVCEDFDKLHHDQYPSYLTIYEEHYHFKITNVKQYITTSIMENEDRAIFKVEEEKTLFELTGVTLIGNGLICEIETSKYRGDKYRFSVNVNH